jgi:tRNA pseudouridine55 synthase
MPTIDGIINFHKPVGITSAKALYRVRAISGMRKSGHTGTLDPAASGVLVLCVGKATKLVERVMGLPKVYRATARLDVTSTSFDSDRPLQPVEVNAIPAMHDVATALARFEGEIEQLPPAVSALKVGGVPAYRLATEDAEAKLKPRRVTIYWTHLRAYAWPEIEFEVAVGRGTYVRALIRDLGAALACGGCLTGLMRTAVGPFDLASAWSEERMRAADPRDYILPLEPARTLLAGATGQVPRRPQ